MLTLRFLTPSRVTIVLNVSINSTFHEISVLLASKFNIDPKFIELQYSSVKLRGDTMVKYVPYYTEKEFSIKFTRPLISIFNFDNHYTITKNELRRKLPYLLTINSNMVDCLTAMFFSKGSLYAASEILLDGSIDTIKGFEGSHLNSALINLAKGIPMFVNRPKEHVPPATYDISEMHKFLTHVQPMQSSNRFEPEEKNLVTQVSIPRPQDYQNKNDDQSTDDASNDIEDDCQEQKTIDINSIETQHEPEKTQETNELQVKQIETNQNSNFDADMWQQYLNNIKDDLFFDSQSIVMGQVDPNPEYTEQSINEQIQAYESTSTDSEPPKTTPPPSPKKKTSKKKQKKADIQPLPKDATVYKVNVRVKEAILADEYA